MKHITTYLHFINIAVLLTLGGCTDEEETTGNASGTTGGKVGSLVIQTSVSAFADADKPTTRTPVENGFATQFQSGDSIGIFCVRPKNGDSFIPDDCKNLKLVYTLAADGTGTWKPEDNLPAAPNYSDATTYVAYYPYQPGLNTASMKDEATIRAWFKANPLLKNDQRTVEKYTACDLMTATALPTADNKLALNFRHEYALIWVKPRVLRTCVSPGYYNSYRPDAKVWAIDMDLMLDEVTVDNENTTMKINEQMACMVNDRENFRLLVAPGSNDSKITGAYVTRATGIQKEITFEGSTISGGFQANTCYALEVHHLGASTAGTVERELQPGDFVFETSNSLEIYPGDGILDANGKIPDYTKAVGIIVTCNPERMTDEECSNVGFYQAYVMGLDNTAQVEWSTTHKDESILPNIPAQMEVAMNNMNGYTETEAMLAERARKGDIDDYPAFKAINEYRKSHPAPVGWRSPWFIPSIGQWYDVMVNLCGRSPETFRDNIIDSQLWRDNSYGSEMWNKINSQLNKVGKPLYYSTSSSSRQLLFRSSSEYDKWFCWGISWLNDSTISFGISNKALTYFGMTVRPFFAF